MMNGFFQCVPYLISMCTDTEKVIRVKADQQLQEIDKKYPGFIHVSLADRDNKNKYTFSNSTVCNLMEDSYSSKIHIVI